MKILFTGGSSFSGMWFIKELTEKGHEVTATLQRDLQTYTGLRRQRIDQLLKCCQLNDKVIFGEHPFLELVSSQNWDLFCHHAADVAEYKSPNFNVASALSNNTKNLPQVLEALAQAKCRHILLTGSIFEQNEGQGSDNLYAVSPYGLSKGLTADTFSFYCSQMKMILGKFVIPNPFGPFEEERFTTYLIKEWTKKQVATIKTPNYVRDNIPISLLSKAYAHFAESLVASFQSPLKFNPSFYAFSQQQFTAMFAEKIRQRLELPCHYEVMEQLEFKEPLIRVNTEPLDSKKFGWEETQFWDELSHYYKMNYLPT